MPAVSHPPPQPPRTISRVSPVAWWCSGPDPRPFEIGGVGLVATPKLDLVASPYATVADVLALSVPEDQAHEFTAESLSQWLAIGASKINGYLGQRFDVPLSVWSQTVVWMNCELAYFGAARRRGQNTEAMLSDFKSREAAAELWLQQARDHEITPDPRLSAEDRPTQPFQLVGPEARGWDGRPPWRPCDVRDPGERERYQYGYGRRRCQ